MKNKILLGIIVCLIHFKIGAQSFIGYSYSDGTAFGAISNPASIAGGEYKYDVNIFAANALVGNTAYSVNKGKYFSLAFRNLKENEDYRKISNDNNRDLWSNIDILGPSVMVSLTDKDAIAITTRFRTVTGVHGLAEDLLQTFGQQTVFNYGQNFNIEDFRSDINMFTDFGVSYGRVLLQNGRHTLRAGITAKYLLGFAGGTQSSGNMLLNIKNADTVAQAHGDVNLAYSEGVDAIIGNGNSKKLSSASGFGLDLGLVYEWYEDATTTKHQRFFTSTAHKLRASVAITDIGHIKYQATGSSSSYSINVNNVPTSEFEIKSNESLDEYISRLQNSGYLKANTNIGGFNIKLPTLLRLNVDYHVFKQWFVNADVGLNLVNRKDNAANNISSFAITPRYEFSFFSLYCPIAYNTMHEFNWGFGANFGMAFIGSSSVISNLFKKEITNGDVYLGVHIPLQKKQHNIK